jgi:hypothetical protein
MADGVVRNLTIVAAKLGGHDRWPFLAIDFEDAERKRFPWGHSFARTSPEQAALFKLFLETLGYEGGLTFVTEALVGRSIRAHFVADEIVSFSGV